ncbi:hypothetical protein KSP40_PGU005899 [Platanthera guangdongensis]|uniref:Uncharacterized protein n=1 Tax=Platanthera guangdongensis TaxID=2320717 RepID=A0ABR2MBV3_9ASPA
MPFLEGQFSSLSEQYRQSPILQGNFQPPEEWELFAEIKKKNMLATQDRNNQYPLTPSVLTA